MSLTLSDAAPQSVETDVLTLLVSESSWEDDARAQLGELGQAVVSEATAEGFAGRASQVFASPTFGRLPARRVVLIGAGAEALDADVIKDLGGRAAKAATAARGARVAAWARWDDAALGGDANRAAALFGEGMLLGAYRFDKYLTRKEGEPAPVRPESFQVLGGGVEAATLAHTEAVAAGVCAARDLANEPPHVCTPDFMADTAADIAARHGFEATLLSYEEVLERGMNLLAAVGRGSEVKPRFIHLKYTGEGPITRKVAYVGKGVTFDTGGYSLKISGSMLNMHMDMGGGAAVLGAAEAVGRIKPEGVEVHFIVPTASNMVSAEAYTVNEIIRGYGGKTVEINNTDAEGRLLLADALAYAAELDVEEIIDLATLTGACVVALGEQYSALFSNDDAMAARVGAAGRAGGERLWHMPLDRKLRDKLKSPVADMKNTGDRWGGAITAALFLSEWIGDKTWTHLDIAGPAMVEADTPICHKGGSGAGVATLVAYTVGA